MLRRGRISILDEYLQVRRHSENLIATLSAEDCGLQSMPDASPSKWHLAHTTWFFETLVLQAFAPQYQCYDPQFAYLFNSYYNSLGKRHARPARGLLSRPSLAQVLAYRQHVDTAMQRFLTQADAEALRRTEIGLHHEQQHQELLLSDILHAFSCNPLLPTYDNDTPFFAQLCGPKDWTNIKAGLYETGRSDSADFAYDNESPRHSSYLKAARISQQLVSNREYRAFIDAGGYDKPDLWLSDGWAWREEHEIDAPLYWQKNKQQQWQSFTLGGLKALNEYAPACHLSYYEADAYARWAGARLPTEAEWELSAPMPEADQQACYGQVWQWTMSPYTPYPGYQTPAGALGEYNAKFMCNQMVLRGSSCATSPGHARRSYRNFFYPTARWQFSGLRLAEDL